MYKHKMTEQTTYETIREARELGKQADLLLRQNGLDRWGRTKRERDSCQDYFEYRMQTGAYCKKAK